MIQNERHIYSGIQKRDMDTKFLEDLGLTPKEIDVYVSLLSLESATIFEIKNKAKVSRMSIYEILEKLLGKGLVSYAVVDGKKQYKAASPERLREYLREKEATLETVLPALMAKYNESKDKTSIEVFVGKEGMKTIMNNIPKVGKPIYAIDYGGKIFEFLQYFMPQLIQKRLKAGIPGKVIFTESFRKNKFSADLTEVKYVPDSYDSPLTITVYADNVNLLIFSENPVAIHIKSREIAQSYMNYFNFMWAIGKE